MINEAFDDDIPDETPVEIVVERPAGQYKRTVGGRTIWFKPAIPGQFNAFRRYREALAARYEALAVRARKETSLEVLAELAELADKIEMSTLEFFESLIVEDADTDFIAMEMIGGRVTMKDLHNVMFVDDEPDDDTVPEVKAKPVRKQPASKKAANAARTRR